MAGIGLLGQRASEGVLWSQDADEAPAAVVAKPPIATYISVGSPVSDAVQAKVLNAARKLQQQAEQESPKAKETISAQDNPVKSNNAGVADES